MTLSLSEARRIAIAAQGLDEPRPARPGLSHIRKTIRRLGLIQIDFVNVLGPAHYMVLFSRLGPYRRALLDQLVYQRREFTEHWAHEASIVPIETWPLLQYRRDTHRVRPYGFESFLAQQAGYVERLLDEVRARGPLKGEGLPLAEGAPKRLRESWMGTPRSVLEAHFGRGLLAIANRGQDFARWYDLTERIIPREHRGRTVPAAEARRELLKCAAKACGVAIAADLADYWRLPVREARPRIAELVESGEMQPVKVEGWREVAYLHREAGVPKTVHACALLSPFDPLIWFRPRTARLFQFEYRFEIFVPREKRRWGVYVLPFLMGDRLVARFDLKADRAGGRLVVVASHYEAGVKAGAIREEVRAELRTLAGWLGLRAPEWGNSGRHAGIG